MINFITYMHESDFIHQHSFLIYAFSINCKPVHIDIPIMHNALIIVCIVQEEHHHVLHSIQDASFLLAKI